MSQYAIHLDNITYSYEGGAVLRNLSLKVRPGEHVGILGDSGCGKSTLLKIVAGLYQPDSGTVDVAEESSPGKIREKVALVMQRAVFFLCLSGTIFPAAMIFRKKNCGLPVKAPV